MSQKNELNDLEQASSIEYARALLENLRKVRRGEGNKTTANREFSKTMQSLKDHLGTWDFSY